MANAVGEGDGLLTVEVWCLRGILTWNISTADMDICDSEATIM